MCLSAGELFTQRDKQSRTGEKPTHNILILLAFSEIFHVDLHITALVVAALVGHVSGTLLMHLVTIIGTALLLLASFL